MNHDNEQDILSDLGCIIGRHADWLSGREFQRLCQQAAEAYFEADDLDQLGTAQEFTAAFLTALKDELRSGGAA